MRGQEVKKRSLIITVAIVAALVVFFATPVPDALFGLFFGGVIPGTEFAIPWFIMLAFYVAALTAVIAWTRRRQLYLGSAKVAKAQAEFMAKNMPQKMVTRKKKLATTTKTKSRSRRSYSRA